MTRDRRHVDGPLRSAFECYALQSVDVGRKAQRTCAPNLVGTDLRLFDAPRCCIDYIMVDTKHAERVEVISRKVIAAPEATDHCALVVKAKFRPQ